MRRAIVLTGALAALLASSCTAEQQICGRMETLCGTSREVCRQLVKDTQGAFGEEGVQGLKVCFAEARSCGEATGCITARGIKNLGEAIEGFFKGLVKGLDEKKEPPSR